MKNSAKLDTNCLYPPEDSQYADHLADVNSLLDKAFMYLIGELSSEETKETIKDTIDFMSTATYTKAHSSSSIRYHERTIWNRVMCLRFSPLKILNRCYLFPKCRL